MNSFITRALRVRKVWIGRDFYQPRQVKRSRITLGNRYADKGWLDRAIADFNKAIEINPKHADAHINRGTVYFYIKKYDNAWRDVNMAQALGYKISPVFLKMLREASGRDK